MSSKLPVFKKSMILPSDLYAAVRKISERCEAQSDCNECCFNRYANGIVPTETSSPGCILRDLPEDWVDYPII